MTESNDTGPGETPQEEAQKPARVVTTTAEVSVLLAAAMIYEQQINSAINSLRTTIADLYTTLAMFNLEAAHDLLERLGSEEVVDGISKMKTTTEDKKVRWAEKVKANLTQNFTEIE